MGGCGSSASTLNTTAVERAIAGPILTERHVHAAVACPSKVPRKAGLVFTCTARLDVGTYPVTATQIDSRGHVRYQNQAPLVILNIAKVQSAHMTSVPATSRLSSAILPRA